MAPFRQVDHANGAIITAASRPPEGVRGVASVVPSPQAPCWQVTRLKLWERLLVAARAPDEWTSST
jgi:hypothetical protein